MALVGSARRDVIAMGLGLWMMVVRRSLVALVTTGLVGVVLMVGGASAWAQAGETRVSTGSPATPFPQNSQDEPAIAIDPMHPNVLAAGANDSIDEPGCNVGEDRICQIESADQAGVGVSGVYFSTNRGQSWTQPI